MSDSINFSPSESNDIKNYLYNWFGKDTVQVTIFGNNCYISFFDKNSLIAGQYTVRSWCNLGSRYFTLDNSICGCNEDLSGTYEAMTLDEIFDRMDKHINMLIERNK